jgi:hypothetical protein
LFSYDEVLTKYPSVSDKYRDLLYFIIFLIRYQRSIESISCYGCGTSVKYLCNLGSGCLLSVNFSCACSSRTESGLPIGCYSANGLISISAPTAAVIWRRRSISSLNVRWLRRVTSQVSSLKTSRPRCRWWAGSGNSPARPQRQDGEVPAPSQFWPAGPYGAKGTLGCFRGRRRTSTG